MNMSDNPFPGLYHLHHQNFVEDLPFWRALARWQGGPILELGCGTGRVLIPLAMDGHRAYGLDSSPGMLAFLRQRTPPELQGNIHLIEGDMTHLQLDLQFRLILLPCNTYSTFKAPERAAILAGVFRHLQPGGVFSLSMPNPNLLAALQSNPEPEVELIFNHPRSGYPVQVSSSWRREHDCVVMNWHYDHLLPDGRVERITASSPHQLVTLETYIREIIATGFTVESNYQDFETKSYKPDANYAILVMKK